MKHPLCVLLLLVSIGCEKKAAAPPTPDPAVQAAFRAKTRPAFVAAGEAGSQIWKEERRFYAAAGDQLVWSDGTRLRPVFDALVRTIEAAPEDGLNPAAYDRDLLVALREQFDPAQAGAVDLRLTHALIKYAWHVSRGTLRPQDVDPLWKIQRQPPNLAPVLAEAVQSGRVEEALESLAPHAPPYHGLRAHLARYRAAAPRDERVIRLIEINMDRWRWMPEELGPRYLIVNIPAFRLDVVEHGTSVLDMKVVTGRKADPTPVLVDEMTEVVFSPYWNIPKTIVDREILPKLDTDPDYFERNAIEMVATGGNSDEMRFRQRPGPRNSLGLVKFVFPNQFNVYLHDTPADSLFNRVERDFSHGCVRLERPMDLARYVLRDQPEWTEPRIAAAMHNGTERAIKLTKPLPVFLVYFTAWDDNGTLQIRPDVYDHDRRQLALSEVEGERGDL